MNAAPTEEHMGDLSQAMLHPFDEAKRGLLRLKEQKDAAYDERDRCVALIAFMALQLGYRVGLARHEGPDWDDDWRNIVFIDLPTGQVSWHYHDSERHLFETLPPYPGEWDGHTTPEKYARVNAAFR